jgi:hypothetical protein
MHDQRLAGADDVKWGLGGINEEFGRPSGGFGGKRMPDACTGVEQRRTFETSLAATPHG